MYAVKEYVDAKLLSNPHISEKTRVREKQFWERIQKVEEETGLHFVDNISRDEAVLLFKKLEAVRSSNTLVTIRSKVVSFLEWAGADAAHIQMIKNITFNDLAEKNSWIRSFDQLNERINVALKCQKDTSRSTEFYRPAIAALYLAWSGVPYDLVFDLKRNDIHTDTVTVNGKDLVLEPRCAKFLNEYKFADGYVGLRVCHYMDSEYLFRGVRTAKYEERSYAVMASKFLSGMDDPECLYYKNVFQAGGFHRVLMYEKYMGKKLNMRDREDKAVFCRFMMEENTSEPVMSLLYKTYRGYADC